MRQRVKVEPFVAPFEQHMVHLDYLVTAMPMHADDAHPVAVIGEHCATVDISHFAQTLSTYQRKASVISRLVDWRIPAPRGHSSKER